MSLAYPLADHYRKASGVYRELGQLDDLHCIGNQDFRGWYRTKPAPDPWDGTGRPWALAAEYPELREGLDRTLYATFGYVPREWYTEAWDRYQWVETDGSVSREWECGGSPTPGYGDLRAYAPFADIDLITGAKMARGGSKEVCLRSVGPPPFPDGVGEDGTGYPDRLNEAIEQALGLYLDAFTELAGDRQHVFALDSVGGVYVFVAPSSTSPIGEAFDAADRELIFSELVSRLNKWLDDVSTEVNDRIPAVEGVFEPDLLNNKNRLYKAPLSTHSSLDGVVTPIDVDHPRYEFTPNDAVDGDLIASAEEWAVGFTGDHADAVTPIVATLWPEESPDADTWRDALTAWLEAKREEQREKEEERKRRKKRRKNRDTDPTELTTTHELDDVLDAIDEIDPEEVVKDKCAKWDTDKKRDPKRFKPGYRSSDSDTSCFVNDDGKIVDLDDKQKAIGVVHYVAREENIIGAKDTATGRDWWRAVDELREDYPIPLLIDPEKEGMSEYYYHDLEAVARRHDIDGDPYADRETLLEACLLAREESPELAKAKPPYAALTAVADRVGLAMADPAEGILGKTTYNVARRVFDDLTP